MAKNALLIGINNYQGVGDLKGCINDVTNVRNILKTYFGFSNDDIRVLVDERATKQNVISRLVKMVTEANPGDFLVFHFSGHGSQIRDRDNDELKDHMDELICPWDMNWDDGFITDDMLRKILDKLKKGVMMEIILDSCHSGSGTRNNDLGRPSDLGPENQILNRYLPPPLDIQSRYQGGEETMKPKKAFRTDEKIIMNHILWAGCKDNQTSADAYINENFNGAFSYYFCKHIRDSKGNISRNELQKRILNSLNYNDFIQIPQLECEEKKKDENVFAGMGKDQ